MSYSNAAIHAGHFVTVCLWTGVTIIAVLSLAFASVEERSKQRQQRDVE